MIKVAAIIILICAAISLLGAFVSIGSLTVEDVCATRQCGGNRVCPFCSGLMSRELEVWQSRFSVISALFTVVVAIMGIKCCQDNRKSGTLQLLIILEMVSKFAVILYTLNIMFQFTSALSMLPGITEEAETTIKTAIMFMFGFVAILVALTIIPSIVYAVGVAKNKAAAKRLL